MSSLNKTWQLLPLLLADLWKEEVAVFVAGKHVVHQHRRPRPVLAQPHLVGSLGADGAGDHHSLHQLGTLSQHRQRTQEPARGDEETRQLRGRGWNRVQGNRTAAPERWPMVCGPITQAEVMSRWRRDKNQREERVKSEKNACGLWQRAARTTKDAFPFTSQLPLIHPAATTN